MHHLAVRSCLFLILSIALSACGKGGGSPATPTSPTAASTRIIAIDGSLAYGDVVVGQSSEITLTIRNTGNSTLTLGDASAPASFASLLTITAGSRTVPAGGSTTMGFRFAPAASGSLSGTVTIAGDQTSGSNTVAFSATGVLTPVTLVGVVTEAGAALGSVTVRVTAGQGTNRTATTDGNGYYSIAGVGGAITVSFTRDGYNTVTRQVTATTDTRLDVSMTRSAPPAPALEYRVIGSRASLTYSNCTNGTSQASNATLPWSFTCASVPTGQFLYISAQNTGDSGVITVQIYKRGVLYRESSSTGAFAIATASGSY